MPAFYFCMVNKFVINHLKEKNYVTENFAGQFEIQYSKS